MLIWSDMYRRLYLDINELNRMKRVSNRICRDREMATARIDRSWRIKYVDSTGFAEVITVETIETTFIIIDLLWWFGYKPLATRTDYVHKWNSPTYSRKHQEPQGPSPWKTRRPPSPPSIDSYTRAPCKGYGHDTFWLSVENAPSAYPPIARLHHNHQQPSTSSAPWTLSNLRRAPSHPTMPRSISHPPPIRKSPARSARINAWRNLHPWA